MASTTENPNEETIKCVVIGDNNTGKTKLVCARAYSQYGPNHYYQKNGGHHIPTVWANDHYRNEIDVLNNARGCIDGVNVSLRLWDTFGDHNKNRRFSYGRADVVLICFSICDSKSLDHISSFWLPEVRHHCKGVPILLVGCKVDLRFANLDDVNKTRTSLVRKIYPKDILYPEICRQTASDLGLPYYETSICIGYGVKDIFENASRAALVYRRKTYLYRNTTLKHVQKPLLQKPLLPSKPDPPNFYLQVLQCDLDFSNLYNDVIFSDVMITCQTQQFNAHKAVLATASNVFDRVFMCRGQKHNPGCEYSVLNGSELRKPGNTQTIEGDKPENEVFVVSVKHVSEGAVDNSHNANDVPDLLTVNTCASNNHLTDCMKDEPELMNSQSCFCQSQFDFLESYIEAESDLSNRKQDVLCLSSDVSQFAFSSIMYFCYKGRLDPKIGNANWLKQHIQQFTDLFMTSQRFGIYDLANLLTELLNEGTGLMPKSLKNFAMTRANAIRDIVLWSDAYSDIVFHVDDGSVPGHKPFLVCGSDMMSAMFGGTFIESANRDIRLPGTTVSSLQVVFEYLYTKTVPSFTKFDVDYCDLIELANRLCLTDLIHLLEHHIIEKYSQKLTSEMGCQFYVDVVQLLEVAQLHNAQNLASWCAYCIATNYNDFCRKCKLMKTLSPENQSLLKSSRWPPVWYIKDFDNYERACKKRAQEESDRRKTYKRL